MTRIFFNLFLAVPFLLIVLAGCGKAPEVENISPAPVLSSPTPTAEVLTDNMEVDNEPRDVVNDFYTAWMDYEGDPLADRIYEDNENVTASFKTQITEPMTADDGISVDPVLCIDGRPDRFAVRSQPVTAASDRTTAVVTETYGSTTVMATVLLVRDEDDSWKIDMIKCAPTSNVTPATDAVAKSPMVVPPTDVPAPVGEGENCGGVDGTSCLTGLLCQYTSDSPDASGICIESSAGIPIEVDESAGVPE